MANDKNILFVEKANVLAKLPFKATTDSAGYDVYSCDNVIVGPGERVAVATGLKMKPPKNCYLRIAAPSGSAFNNGIKVPFPVNIGERIAQVVVEKYKRCSLVEVGGLDTTERGASGFGSSGDGLKAKEFNLRRWNKNLFCENLILDDGLKTIEFILR